MLKQESLKIKPKEITFDEDNNIHMASYDYYNGRTIAKFEKLSQTTSFSDVFNKSHFIVCCGDVMIRVDKNDYPDIPRRFI